jgi:hypothetical protein
VPTLASLLGQARPVAHHPLDKVMCHPEADLGPVAEVPEVPPANRKGKGDPAKKQERVELSPRTCAEDHRGHNELDPRDEREKATAQGKGFHCLWLDDEPKELAGPLMAYLLWLEPQGPIEKPWFEESPRADSEQTLRPNREQPERD